MEGTQWVEGEYNDVSGTIKNSLWGDFLQCNSVYSNFTPFLNC